MSTNAAVSSLVVHGQALCSGHVWGLQMLFPAVQSIRCGTGHGHRFVHPCFAQRFSKRNGFQSYWGLVIDAEALHQRHDGGHSVVGVGLLRLLQNSSFEANDSVCWLLVNNIVANAVPMHAMFCAHPVHRNMNHLKCKSL